MENNITNTDEVDLAGKISEILAKNNIHEDPIEAVFKNDKSHIVAIYELCKSMALKEIDSSSATKIIQEKLSTNDITANKILLEIKKLILQVFPEKKEGDKNSIEEDSSDKYRESI